MNITIEKFSGVGGFCRTCIYVNIEIIKDQHERDIEKSECREKPPLVMPIPMQGQLQGSVAIQLHAYYPPIDPDSGWCGCYEPSGIDEECE